MVLRMTVVRGIYRLGCRSARFTAVRTMQRHASDHPVAQMADSRAQGPAQSRRDSRRRSDGSRDRPGRGSPASCWRRNSRPIQQRQDQEGLEQAQVLEKTGEPEAKNHGRLPLSRGTRVLVGYAAAGTGPRGRRSPRAGRGDQAALVEHRDQIGVARSTGENTSHAYLLSASVLTTPILTAATERSDDHSGARPDPVRTK